MARKRKKAPVVTGPPSDPTAVYGIDPSRARSGGGWYTPVSTTPGGGKPALKNSSAGVPSVSPLLVKDTNGNPIVGTPGAPNAAKPQAAGNYLTQSELTSAKQAKQVGLEQSKATTEAEGTDESPWWVRLFDTTNTWKPVTNADGSYGEKFQGLGGSPVGVIGGMWDTGLRALQWGTDRIAQASVALISAAPGGTRTWTWDEAGNVSLGQQIVAGAAESEGRRRRGEATFGDFLSMAQGIPAIGAYIAGAADADTPLQQKNFDLQNAEQKDKAFSQGWERVFSGGADFAFAFADPTILAGGVGKIAKLRYLDVLIDSPEKMQKAIDGVYAGKKILQNNLGAAHSVEDVASGVVTLEKNIGDAKGLQVSPATMFIHNSTRVDEAGKKVMSFDDIYNHKVIRFSTNREGVAAAFHNAETFDEAALVYRYAIGDSTAADELAALRPDIMSAIVDGEQELLKATLAQNPAKLSELIAERAAKIDQYDAELAYTKATMGDSPDLIKRLDYIRERKAKVMDEWVKLSNGELPATPIEDALNVELARRRLRQLEAKDRFFKQLIDEAAGISDDTSGVYGAMRESTKGFSSDTKFGRWAEGRRQATARAQSETEALRSGFGLSERALWRATDVPYLNGARGVARRVARVWRYASAEAPSGLVRLSGISAQESAREVRAMLNSIRMYGGAEKTVTITLADGTSVVKQVGGQAAKEKMLTDFVNALTEGGVAGRDNAALALKRMEEQIVEDIGHYYDFHPDVVRGIYKQVDSSRQALRKQITETGFWTEGKVDNRAPYLETHLQDAEIMAPWRAIERKVYRTRKDDSTFSALADTGKQWTADTYGAFQDLWRPATLLRLGYTQRNVAEGLFRASAFQFSLMPIVDAARQGVLSGGNVAKTARYGSRGQRGMLREVSEGVRTGKMPKQFTEWHTKQIEQIDNQLATHQQVVDLSYEQLARESETWRAATWKKENDFTTGLIEQKVDIRTRLDNGTLPEGMSVDDANLLIQRNTALIDESYRRQAILSRMKGMGDDGPVRPELQVVSDDLDLLTTSIEPMLVQQKASLTNVKSAAYEFRKQTLAKRRLWQGEATVADPDTLKGLAEAYRVKGQAFDPFDPYTNIALKNLSADHTTRQALALQMSTVERLFTATTTRHHVEVKPGEPGYWDGLAVTLSQWKNSDIGRIVIDGMAARRTPDEITAELASFIRQTDRGREIGMFITRSSENLEGKTAPYNERVAKAHAKATKDAAPLRKEADAARADLQAAHDALAVARKEQKQAFKDNPRYRTLRDEQGQTIPKDHVERTQAAADRVGARVNQAKEQRRLAEAEVRDQQKRVVEVQKAADQRVKDAERAVKDAEATVARAQKELEKAQAPWRARQEADLLAQGAEAARLAKPRAGQEMSDAKLAKWLKGLSEEERALLPANVTVDSLRRQITNAERRAKAAEGRMPTGLKDAEGKRISDPEAYVESRRKAVAAAQERGVREVERSQAQVTRYQENVQGWTDELAIREQSHLSARQSVADAKRAVSEAKKRRDAANAANPPAIPIRINGKKVNDPDAWLAKHQDRYDKAEAKWAEYIEDNSTPAPQKGLTPILSMEDAVIYAEEMVRRYAALTASSPELQTFLAAQKTLTQAGREPLREMAATLETMLGKGAVDPAGNPYRLIPIIGSESTVVGAKGVMDSLRTLSNKAFYALGTVPEDTFVRAPFYGRRWQRTYDAARSELLRQRKEQGRGWSVADENMIRELAHRRALKDTKDWLYTIDRRTLLGQYGEAVMPFISATQNSVTTIGRIAWNNPLVFATMALIWNAPARSGLMDEKGDMHISFPLDWMPEDMREKFGLSAMADMTFNISQFDLISPNPSGGVPLPTPGPVVVVPLSEMEKRGWLFSPAAPDILQAAIGPENAQTLWSDVHNWVYGSSAAFESGVSARPLSLDKALPAWMQKAVDIIAGEGESSGYTSWYDKIYQSEYLRWMAGERDAPPTPNEIHDTARNFQALRLAANLTAFTPPGYTSQITPIVDSVYKIYEQYPNDRALADQKVYELYGDIAPSLQALSKVTSTQSISGLPPSLDSMRLMKEHEDVIGAIAPTLAANDTLSVLGMMGDQQKEYNPNVSAIQLNTEIPNTGRMYREYREPAVAMLEAQKAAGWTEWIKSTSMLKALAAQRGLKSLQSKGAEDLLATQRAKAEQLKNDPRTAAWYADYKNFSSKRTADAVLTATALLGNQKWRDDNVDNPVWQNGGAAEQYIDTRNSVLEMLGRTTDSDMKKAILQEWQEFRGELSTTYPDWGTIQERYFAGDDTPEDPQVLVAPETTDYVPDQGAPMLEQSYGPPGPPGQVQYGYGG